MLGSGAVLTDQESQQPFLREWRGRYSSACLAVVLPESGEQVAAVMRLCGSHQTPVVTQGGNTGLCGGAVSTDDAILLSLQRANRIHKVDAQNQVIDVDAGCTLAQVQSAAIDAGMLFSVSLVPREQAQVGGMIATNAGGTNVLRYGNMRRQVLGLEVVLADGRIWQDLRPLTKDNSGYDLNHLFVGSEGTLGIITRAQLRLYPKPARARTALIGLPGMAEAITLFQTLRELTPNLTACEVFPRFALELVLRHGEQVRDPLPQACDCYLLVEVEEFGCRDRSPLSDMPAQAGVDSACMVVAADEAESKSLWALRKQIPAAQTREGASIKHDISLPLSEIAGFLQRGRALIEAQIPGARPCVFGHLGDGNLHFNISQPLDMSADDFRQREVDLHRAVYDLVAECGGSFAAEHGIGQLKLDELVRYKSPSEVALMRQIKLALDPENLLNPGKVLPVGD